MNNVPSVLLRAAIGATLCALVGCSGSTQMSLTGNTPAQYSHMWVTTQELWFNSNAAAGPDDAGWYKFSLSTPTTIDVVAEGGGNLASITDSLRVLPGTYSQVRIIPVDPSTALTTSAQQAGALYNSEADYVDASGVTHQLPLEFLNPDKGIGIQTALKVPIGDVGAALENGTGSTTGTNTTTGTTIGSTTGTTTGTTTDTSTGTALGIGGTTAGTTTGTTGTASSTQTPNQFAITEDGTTDLVPFTYGTTTGVLLSQHATAYDLSKSGGISGQLTLTNITSSTSGLPNIQVSAQVLSADGTRHVEAATTTVQADGTFLLYPLAASTNGTYYDVVIHGPSIATIIIKSVVVTLPSSSSSNTTSATTTTDSSTTTTSTSTTSSSTGSTNASANNVVAIGTLTPRTATSYTVNMSTSPAATLPAGATLGFYQTLASQGSVPYVIESSPIDPFNEVLFNAEALSTGTIDSGTWSSSGATVTVISAAPSEGAGNYIVSPYATGYGEAVLSTVVKAPATSTPAAPVSVAAPALPLAADSVAGVLHATVQTTPGKYTAGELLVSYNGTLMGSVSLGALASGTDAVALSGLPAQIPSAMYYVTVRAWNASDPAASLHRQWYPQLIDMRSASSASIALSID